MDGFVDFADIPPFIAVLISDNFQAEADIDLSGRVNFADIPPFVEVLTSHALPTNQIVDGLWDRRGNSTDTRRGNARQIAQ